MREDVAEASVTSSAVGESLALDQRVGDHRGGVHDDAVDVAWREPRRLEHGIDAGEKALDQSCGVVRVLSTVSWPDACRSTMSVNVPPISTANE